MGSFIGEHGVDYMNTIVNSLDKGQSRKQLSRQFGRLIEGKEEIKEGTEPLEEVDEDEIADVEGIQTLDNGSFVVSSESHYKVNPHNPTPVYYFSKTHGIDNGASSST